MDVRAIRNDQDHAATVAEIERLWGSEPGSDAAERLELLAILANDYEARRWPIDPLDPVEALRGHMDMNGYTQSDLAEVLGSQSRASEILNRQRRLTLEQIRRIESRWKLPATYLVADYPLQTKKILAAGGRLKAAVSR